jgi:hypothetical protein
MFKQFEDTKYYVSEKGEVKRTYKNGNTCFLKPYLNKNGYKTITMRINGKSIKKYLHRLIAKMYIINTNVEYDIVDHIDRNKLNNNKNNLRWVNCSINSCNSERVIFRKGCICKTKDKVKGKIYEYYRVFWYDLNHKKKSKRFIKKIDAELFLNVISARLQQACGN